MAETRTIEFGGYRITYDMDALGRALDSVEPDERMRIYPVALWEFGVMDNITVKMDDGYDEDADGDVDYYASGRHVLRLTEPDSGEPFVLVSLGDYEATVEPC